MQDGLPNVKLKTYEMNWDNCYYIFQWKYIKYTKFSNAKMNLVSISR
jgi:hypothetical protein